MAYRRDPEVARYQGWTSDYGAADAERFLAEQQGLDLVQAGAWVQRAAVTRAGGVLVGDCAVHALREPPWTAEVGITLAREHQGRGLAAEILRALVGALFEAHGMHRVIAHADDRNAPVHRLLERVGFRCEGRFVEADWFEGAWETLRVHAVLEREWRTR